MKKEAFLKAGILLLSLSLLPGMLGCGAISNLVETPTSTPTSTPTATSTLTATLTPTRTPTLIPPTATLTSMPVPESIVQAMRPAADGQGVPEAGVYNPDSPGPHRLVILGQSGDWHAYNDQLPIDWQPSAVDEIELIVLLNNRKVQLGSREYSGGVTAYRYRWEMDVQLREVRTGFLLATTTLRGSEPKHFEDIIIVKEGTTVVEYTGSSPTYEDFENWLDSWPTCDGMGLCLLPRHTLEGHTKGVHSVAFSPDGQTLASGSSDNTIRLWRVSDGALMRTLEGHTNSVYTVAFSPDGQTLAFAGPLDKTVRLWQVSDWTLLRTLKGNTLGVTSVAFSPDGQTLASGSFDDTVRLWRVSDGTLLRTLEGHKDSVNSVAFSPDGQTLASGSFDNTVRLWQVSDGTLLRTLEGHTDGVTSVAFSPDGQTMASGSLDRTLRIWRVSDGVLLRMLEGHKDSVTSVAFSPDGQTLASGSSDKTVRLWWVRGWK